MVSPASGGSFLRPSGLPCFLKAVWSLTFFVAHRIPRILSNGFCSVLLQYIVQSEDAIGVARIASGNMLSWLDVGDVLCECLDRGSRQVNEQRRPVRDRFVLSRSSRYAVMYRIWAVTQKFCQCCTRPKAERSSSSRKRINCQGTWPLFSSGSLESHFSTTIHSGGQWPHERPTTIHTQSHMSKPHKIWRLDIEMWI